jgi:T-complex protein 1 subunit gamma
MEVIPRTLAQNCGANVVRVVTALRAKHAEGGSTWGINGNTGEPVDMRTLGVWEPYSVKVQTIKTAIEVRPPLLRAGRSDAAQASCMLLRIDEIVSGLKRKQERSSGPAPSAEEQAGAAEQE